MDTETLVIAICGYVAFCGLMVAPLWVIFRRAGLRPLLSLVFIVPVGGPLLALYFLAFQPWPAAAGAAPD